MKLDPNFIYQCRNAIEMMRRAGIINETLIACVIQDVRFATLNEESRRLSELLRTNPPHHYGYDEIADVIKEAGQ